MKTINKNIGVVMLIIAAISFLLGSSFNKSPEIKVETDKEAIPFGFDVLSIRSSDAKIGDGEILLIEYSDFECPFCTRFHHVIKELVIKNEITYIYRHLPLPFHKTAKKGAIIADCLRKEEGGEAFWEYISNVFEEESKDYEGLAIRNGLSQGQIDKCLVEDSPEARLVESQINEARLLGFSGTPSSIAINKKTGAFVKLPGYLEIEKMNEILEKLKQQ